MSFEAGDIIRLKRLTTISRSPLVSAEVNYRPPKGTDFVVLVIGAATPEQDTKVLAETVLHGLGLSWESMK